VKIAWLSNAPWAPTGYGTQTASIVPRIKAAGHDIAILANWGLVAGARDWDGITVLPQGKDPYSNDIIQAHVDHLEADWLITLYDVWVLNRKLVTHPRIVSWTPVDHQPVPPQVGQWAGSVRTVAMSRFGQRMFRDEGISAEYIPHSIDTRNTFKPTPEHPTNGSVRRWLKVPDDAFLVMVNAANNGTYPYRKSWPEMFAAIAFIQRDHPDAYVYIHTDTNAANGLNLHHIAASTGMDAERVRWADPYEVFTGAVSQQMLASMYTAADVLLAPSMGEGFGIPVIEAQACGTPVIVSDYSAQPELVGAGWKVKGQPFWNFTQRAWLQTPSIPGIIGALKEAREAKGSEELRDKALAKAAEYDTDKVFPKFWLPLLAEMEATLKQPAAELEAPRAERRRQERAAKKAAKRRRAA